jgi:hypothetical protein
MDFSFVFAGEYKSGQEFQKNKIPRFRGGEIGFVWLCIGFVLALFSASEQFDIFS